MLCAFGHIVGVNVALEITFMNYELYISLIKLMVSLDTVLLLKTNEFINFVIHQAFF